MSRISIEQMRNLLKVYFIMGSNNCQQEPTHVLELALKGGITLFQFREKGTSAYTGDEKYQFAKKLQTICKENNVPFIVNDDVELALLLDADGVHIGQDDESAEMVRRKIGNKILGVSTHNLEEVEKAIAEGADYVGIGPIYSTTTKEDAKSAQGTTLIAEVRSKGIEIPIVGIGGITSENASPIIKSGADGIAVITDISLANDPRENASKLINSISI
ncbi:thiamine phosphate synthase [Metabacillus sediminilitoris]|uniref:Thiamine-phosphate synthase n=1 Tax=Metabacillus sediminilitoris TaxID=2567941 RepID=A0A4S4BVW2_9BACI|nr:thiamine phosphate synthase [Metabacillus sediminilitoris]QGQ44938.1 thiamine phosphate synthase [Metabacillus sediminilitoris]THF78571.1 thiamine phosphate synthase [Metabacillus sediminilitoris]